MSKANPYDRLVGFIRFHNIHINEEMKLRDIVKEIVAFEKPQPPSQSPQTPIDREPEGIDLAKVFKAKNDYRICLAVKAGAACAYPYCNCEFSETKQQ